MVGGFLVTRIPVQLVLLTPQQRDHVVAGLTALQRLHHDPDILDGIAGQLMSLDQIDDLKSWINTEPTFGQVVQHYSTKLSPKEAAYIDAARALERDGELEIDDYTMVSLSMNGAYVMAWVFVGDDDA